MTRQPHLLKPVLTTVAVATVSWYIYKLFIRPFLSPLRKIPGRSYKPIIGNMQEALQEEAMTNTINWMKEHKSRIIRYYYLYGEERVLVADPEIVKYITVTNSKNYHRLSNLNLQSMVGGFILLTAGEEHHALRKLLNPAFNSQSVNEFIPVFEETARKVVKCWMKEIKEGGGEAEAVAAQSYMSRLTLEVICRCGFDYEVNPVEDPSHSGVQSFQRILQGLEIRLSMMLPLQWLPTKKNRQLWADMKFFRSTIKNVVKQKREKLKADDRSKDLLSLLLKARDEQGNALTDQCLCDQVGGFLFAGFETTSISLTWTLLMLAEHKDIQQKVRQEIMSVLPNKSQAITAKTVDNLTYLTCVIKESLRLLPPVTVLFRRAIKDDYLGGYFIPAGTAVGVSIGALHRLPENWENPNAFKPERFLEPYDHYKFMPFNTGPYMCIGHIFSLTETKVTLAILLRYFDISLTRGYEYRRVRQLVMQPRPPLTLHVSPL